MFNAENKALVLAAYCSGLAAMAHLGCIIFGGDWYRFFGTGEQMATLAEQGHWYPSAVTSVIVVVLSIWTLYGLSAAKVIRQLPLIRLALIVISSIYLIRGVGFIWLMPMFPGNSLTFWLVSSGICLTIGLLYAVGTLQMWPRLNV
ncbi:hypothetical protein TUM4644_16600 [Shewanella colwelliana]|uniref:hypothetical protein n=1 Tax=Shewanella colwelliana TaxID=23 RepID=UPI001BC78EE3|nr:hypothetical protein [Shewanella colwelliana]GIU23293.1 hypothetical protein TUM4644_16600 [Shewanella colwelliana]